MAVTLSLALALAACGGSDGAEASGSGADRDRPTTTLSRTQRDEQAVRELIEGWFEQRRKIAYGEASIDTAKDFATEEGYARQREVATNHERLNLISRPDPADRTTQRIESVEVDESEASVIECAVNGDLLVREGTSAVVDDSVAARRIEYEVRRLSEGWRITRTTTLEEWPNAESCP